MFLVTVSPYVGVLGWFKKHCANDLCCFCCRSTQFAILLSLKLHCNRLQSNAFNNGFVFGCRLCITYTRRNRDAILNSMRFLMCCFDFRIYESGLFSVLIFITASINMAIKCSLFFLSENINATQLSLCIYLFASLVVFFIFVILYPNCCRSCVIQTNGWILNCNFRFMLSSMTNTFRK